MFGFLTSGPREIADPLASVKAVSAWLRSLPSQDVIGRQQAVLGAFDSLRQARRPLEPARVQALLFLDAALGADRRQLTKQYVENADGGTQLSKRIWKAAFDLSQGYETAYQSILEEALLQSNNPRWKSLVPLLFARLIHYFGSDAKLRVFRFERWIPAKWVELHHVYMRAAELGIDRVPTVLGHGPNTTQWTVEQEYVYALLIHQLNTGNMTPGELDWAFAQIRGWSRRLSLDAVARSMEGFLVDVGGKTGLVRPLGNDAGLMLRYLDTTPVCDQLDRAVTALRRAESPERSGVLSINQRRIAILEKIRPSIAPNLNSNLRRDPRSACGVTARVRVGLTRICHELASSAAKDAISEEAASPDRIEQEHRRHGRCWTSALARRARRRASIRCLRMAAGRRAAAEQAVAGRGRRRSLDHCRQRRARYAVHEARVQGQHGLRRQRCRRVDHRRSLRGALPAAPFAARQTVDGQNAHRPDA